MLIILMYNNILNFYQHLLNMVLILNNCKLNQCFQFSMLPRLAIKIVALLKVNQKYLMIFF